MDRIAKYSAIYNIILILFLLKLNSVTNHNNNTNEK